MARDITIVTHSSRFHSDDVFAVATLLMHLESDENAIHIVRSREPAEIERGDYIVDIGHEYDPSRNRFDHHQPGGAGERENGIPYASFGLVWKHYGPALAGSQEAADMIDEKVAQPVDAMDNGIDLYEPIRSGVHPYLFHNVTFAFDATWQEQEEGSYHRDQMFLEVVNMAKPTLEREIRHARAIVEGKPIVEEIYQNTEDKRLIVMDNHYPYEHVLPRYPEPLLVVRTNPQDETWKIEVVADDYTTFERRMYLPEAWAGLRGADFEEETGVDGAVFCHRGRHMAVAASKEAALALARTALEA